MNIIGWIGSVCLALCGIPQAVKTIQTRSAGDISIMFLLLWLIGEVLTLVYIVPKLDWPLLFNYSVNIIVIAIVLRYKWLK
jgi:uncharacterized protein with PQ loop repeat